MATKLEYIWLDGYKPTQSLRSKTKILSEFSGKLSDCPDWSFDGSSTEQAPGGSSDCVLRPVFICKDPARLNGYLGVLNCLFHVMDPSLNRITRRRLAIFGTFLPGQKAFGFFHARYPCFGPELHRRARSAVARVRSRIVGCRQELFDRSVSPATLFQLGKTKQALTIVDGHCNASIWASSPHRFQSWRASRQI